MTRFKIFSALLLGSLLCACTPTQTSSVQHTALQKGNNPVIKLHTNHGDITLELDPEKAPDTVKNFIDYVNDGFYNDTIFHRVIGGFMIQGGGMASGMKEKKTRAPIKNEAANGLKNEPYTIAMARTNDPHSASAQFFINVANNDFLNHTSPDMRGYGYAVFGKVIDGKEVVDAISRVKTRRSGFHDDVPVEDVIITKAEVLK
jgi:peptidyl-prolyl cis-trans isomerase B (cyclophilin B)